MIYNLLETRLVVGKTFTLFYVNVCIIRQSFLLTQILLIDEAHTVCETVVTVDPKLFIDEAHSAGCGTVAV